MKNYDLIPKLILRTPLLPINILLGKKNFDRNDLLQYYNNPVVKEALFLASPNLYSEFIRWTNNEIEDPQEVQRLENALLKYLSRMSTRCTPFGTFAGFSLIDWGKETRIDVSSASLQKCTRLDMHFLFVLAKDVVNHPDIKFQLKYHPNRSIYLMGGEWRYIETIHQVTSRKYVISAVEDSEYLRLIFDRSKGGASIDELVEELRSNDIEKDEAAEFVDDLIKSQILVSELEPSLTGGDVLVQLVDTLSALHAEKESAYLATVVQTLKEAQAHLEKLDKVPGAGASEYEKVFVQLSKLGTLIDKKYLFQVDLKRSFPHATVDNKLAGTIRRAAALLDSIMPGSAQGTLEQFKQAFQDRYETQEVPLLIALDNESGVGFPPNIQRSDLAPLVENIQIPSPENQNDVFISKGNNQKMMHRKYLDALISGAYEVTVKEEDFRVEESRRRFPDSFNVMGTFLGKNKAGEDEVFIKFASGLSSAVGLLGRFTPIDSELTTFCKSITAIEDKLNPGVILAEIIHLPQARMGNIVARERLREYEIPFMARSSSDEDHQVPVDDLMLSVTPFGEIILRSKRLNRRIIPRMATAHNYARNAQPIYHFLCELQSQNIKAGLSMGWGQTGITYPFRPRIKYGNVVLARATWLFDKDDLTFFKKKKQEELLAAVKEWQHKWRVPDRIFLVDGDNELFIDLGNVAMVRLLADEIKDVKQVTLVEDVFVENSFLTDDDNQTFTNEFIASFVRKPVNATPGKSTMQANNTGEATRRFIHGSEWLFYKIYLGPKVTESVLANHIKPLVEDLSKNELIDRWFFIRYADPRHHLRLRFHLKDVSQIGTVIRKIYDCFLPLVTSGVIFKIQTDTYDREIERYGEQTIHLIERIFHHQSNQVLQFLKITEGSANVEALRYSLMIRGTSNLMQHFKFDNPEKKKFLDESLSAYEKEFRANKNTFQHLSFKYKEHSKMISMLLNGEPLQFDEWTDLEVSIKHDEIAIERLVAEICSIRESTLSVEERTALLWSLCHMLVNRLALTNGRKHELLLYSDLSKHFASYLARMKHTEKIDN